MRRSCVFVEVGGFLRGAVRMASTENIGEGKFSLSDYETAQKLRDALLIVWPDSKITEPFPNTYPLFPEGVRIYITLIERARNVLSDDEEGAGE